MLERFANSIKHISLTGSGWLVLLMLLTGGCEKSPVFDCFTATGNIVREERQLGQFNSIILRDNVNLYLRQSNQHKAVVEAGSNLLSKIITEMKNDTILEIRNDNRCNWVRSYDKPVNVYLHVDQLVSLEYRSTGDVTNTDTLRLDSLSIDVREGAGKIRLCLKTNIVYSNLHYGTADIQLKGKTDLSIVYGGGFGRIDNRGLKASQNYVNNISSNDMYIHADLRIGATIENIGNIYYSGNPSVVDLQRLGTGDLIPLE